MRFGNLWFGWVNYMLKVFIGCVEYFKMIVFIFVICYCCIWLLIWYGGGSVFFCISVRNFVGFMFSSLVVVCLEVNIGVIFVMV